MTHGVICVKILQFFENWDRVKEMKSKKEFMSLADLSGKTAIVTGGLGMLGSEFVKTLASYGAKVAIFDIKETVPKDLKEMIDGGSTIKPVLVNIVDATSVKKGFEEIVASFGIPTILVNNAGLDSHPSAPANQNGPFEDYSEDVWDSVLDSHLKGAFLVSREFFKAYKKGKEKSGSIINLASIYGLVSPDQSVYEYRRKNGENFFKPISYTVSKAGIVGLTKWLAEYGGPFGIRVNTLAPGGVFANQDKKFTKEYTRRTMLGKMADKADYNGAMIFLASGLSSYMTGATLVVDGGWTAR